VWANVDLGGYDHFAHPLHIWVNDVGMVFFFALAAKEVFEATLPGGPLASPRRALSPLAAAVGGMAAPAAIYVALASQFGPANLVRGWAIPCATDIAFSAMIARIIFPRGHPAKRRRPRDGLSRRSSNLLGDSARPTDGRDYPDTDRWIRRRTRRGRAPPMPEVKSAEGDLPHPGA
jgi:hypothetical protein